MVRGRGRCRGVGHEAERRRAARFGGWWARSARAGVLFRRLRTERRSGPVQNVIFSIGSTCSGRRGRRINGEDIELPPRQQFVDIRRSRGPIIELKVNRRKTPRPPGGRVPPACQTARLDRRRRRRRRFLVVVDGVPGAHLASRTLHAARTRRRRYATDTQISRIALSNIKTYLYVPVNKRIVTT